MTMKTIVVMIMVNHFWLKFFKFNWVGEIKKLYSDGSSSAFHSSTATTLLLFDFFSSVKLIVFQSKMLDHYCDHNVLLCHLGPIIFHQTFFQDHIKCSLQHHLHSPQRESKLKSCCHHQISFVFFAFFWIRNGSCQIIVS